MEIFIQILNVIPLLARIDIPNRLAFKKKLFIFWRFLQKIMMLTLIKNVKIDEKFFFFN